MDGILKNDHLFLMKGLVQMLRKTLLCGEKLKRENKLLLTKEVLLTKQTTFFMKKNLFYLFALVCSLSLFTACSDDDEPNYTQVIEEEIQGDYKGTLDVAIDGTTIATGIPQKITVAGANATSINLSLTNFSFMGFQVGDVSLENCRLTQDGDTYTFTGTTSIDVTGLTATVNATGSIGNSSVSITMNIAAVAGTVEQAVAVTYTGTKLNGTEGTGADILTFTIDNSVVTEQPTINEDNTITFKVAEDADVTALVPTITVSEGATITPAGGVAQDFSNGKTVTYTVVSEDYGTTKTYTVSVAGNQTVEKYSFDEWTEVSATVLGFKTMQWLTPQPTDYLATANHGVAYLKAFDYEGEYATTQETDGYSGSAVKLTTLYTKGKGFGLAPAITPGSLFTGKFEFQMVTDQNEQIKLTKFGVPFDKVPVRFRGVYKYTAGDNFVNGSDKNNVQEGLDQTDECSIQAVLYEATDENGAEVILTGVDINNSPYRVAQALLEDGSPKEDWTAFDIPFTYFEGKSYDASKTYKLAIVCSSSKEGASFIGAANSTLWVDEFEIISE